MKIGIVSFTEDGFAVSETMRKYLTDFNHEVWMYTKSKLFKDQKATPIEGTLLSWTKKMFESADAIIFTGACGIAVRSIAPFVKDKKKDPAVLVVDESGKFCISLLSGHLGGANDLCRLLSEAIGAVPVITTATDIRGQFAVDEFAKKNQLHIASMTYAKEISADLLARKKVGVTDESKTLEEIGNTFPQLVFHQEGELPLGIYIGIYRWKKPYMRTLYLTPQVVTLGIGCRRGIPMEKIQNLVESVCIQMGISFHALKQVATIDRKKDEPGIIEYAQKYHLPMKCFTAEELLEVQGNFSASDFVKSTVGVENVCERSAVLASKNGTLIKNKTARDGVTVALAVEEWRLSYDE